MDKRSFKIIGDNPAGPGEDRLKFGEFINPLADRLLESHDHTPFTIGIHAPWGQGKSTAMQLLESTLKEKSERVRTLFFYPWKYHNREEVWRGLVSAMVRAIYDNDSLKREWKRKKPGVIRVLAKILWRRAFALTGLGGKGDADDLINAIATEPWSPDHLHSFEQTLDERFEELGAEAGGSLFVLFVDDLDRCLPESAAAVLEAMKLVLNRSGLITVLGVADRELARAVHALYLKALGDQAEALDRDWGKDYLRKIIQIPLYLPRVSDEAFNDYIHDCLNKSGVGDALVRRDEKAAPLVETVRWSPVLRKSCHNNLREVKRFINHFIAEWDKVAAGALLADGGLQTVLPERVAFILLLERLSPRFCDHCFNAVDLGLLLRYQQWFLEGGVLEKAPAPPQGTEAEFTDDLELMNLFREVMLPANEGEEALVEPFGDKIEVFDYVRFGRPPEGDAEEVDTAPEVEEVEEAVSEPEPEPQRKEKPRTKRGASKAAKQKRSGQFDALLRQSREALSANRPDEAEKSALEGAGMAVRTWDAEMLGAFLEVAAEGVLRQGLPSRLPGLMGDIQSQAQSGWEPGRLPVAHAVIERVRARFRDRLREMLRDSKAAEAVKEGAEGVRAALNELEDRRPGVGCDPESGLPAMAWVPVQGAEGIRLGNGMREGQPDPEFPEDAEKWESEESLTLAPFLMAAYPVTVAQYRPFVEQGGYLDPKAPWWTAAGREQVLKREGRTAPARWDDPDYRLDNHPVTGLTWFEAVAYCRWLTIQYREKGLLPEAHLVRLPTEAEWEWAARGPGGLRWPWGDEWPRDALPCNSEEAEIGSVSAVGSFPAARSHVVSAIGELSLPGEPADAFFDQAGNVWEWCSTGWWDNYPLPLVDEWSSIYLEADYDRVLRGGSFSRDRSRCRGAYRFRFDPWNWNRNRGFRCCVATSSPFES